MAGVKLVGVSKRFGKFTAVKNINIHVRDREFLVMLGPSGCGKTTILRIIAGLEKPSTGQVYIGDEIVADADRDYHLPPKDRDVAMVFQSYALYPHMNVYQNIAFPLQLRKVPKEEIDRVVKDVADLLGIRDILHKKPSELSGGQRQRVALGRAIVRQPRVFLMDEPLSNLDAKLRIKMRMELRKLQKELGITTIYVTHDQMEAMTMGDRIVVMNNGKIQQIGEPGEIYRKPVNTFVAGFIGSPPMNLIDATVTEDGALDTGEFRLKIPEIADVVGDYVGEDVVLGVRPEDVFRDENGIEFRVEAVEPFGNIKVAYLRRGDLSLTAQLPEVYEGENLKVSFRTDKIHVFDKKTGKAIM